MHEYRGSVIPGTRWPWIYTGLGAYLGKPTVQSCAGDVLGHVIDVSAIEPESRGYRKGGGQDMHVEFHGPVRSARGACWLGPKA